MCRIVTCLCVSFLCVTVTQGEDPKPRSDDEAAIEKVVADSMEAGQKMDWKRYAELLHPDSLQEHKNMWLPVLQAATRERPEEQADLLSAFEKATDLQTLIALKPKEFFVSSMKGMASQIPALSANPLNVDQKIIGTVHEGDDRAYDVVRTCAKTDQGGLSRVEAVSLKRSGTEWKLMLPDVVRIIAETFRWIGPEEHKSGPMKDRSKPDKKRE